MVSQVLVYASCPQDDGKNKAHTDFKKNWKKVLDK